MKVVLLGSRWPGNLPPGEGLITAMSKGGLQGILRLNKLSKDDIDLFQKSPIEVHVALIEKSFPFLALRFGKGELEVDSLLVLPPGEQHEAMSNPWNTFQLFLIEGKHNIVRGFRMLGLKSETVELLRNALNQPQDVVELQRKVRELYSRYTTNQIYELASVVERFERIAPSRDI